MELGFEACGIAPAGEAETLQQQKFMHWIEGGYHGKMYYMANHFEKRMNPAVLVSGAKSVICLAMNYHQKPQPKKSFYKVSQYAAGQDYHPVLKRKLFELLDFIRQNQPLDSARVFTDSAPVLERYWAQKAGLGGVGKNTCLIIPRRGSFFFLAEIILDATLDYDTPWQKDMCGRCTRCMDACPTGAIVAPGKLDARRCISYLTIELKEHIPEEFAGKTTPCIFGCDICQTVCPHNEKFARPCSEPAFDALNAIKNWGNTQWENLDDQGFRDHFKRKNSAIARISFQKLKDNIEKACVSSEKSDHTSTENPG